MMFSRKVKQFIFMSCITKKKIQLRHECQSLLIAGRTLEQNLSHRNSAHLMHLKQIYVAQQGRIQPISKVGVHIRVRGVYITVRGGGVHIKLTITRGSGACPPGKKLIFGKNRVHFL